MIDSSSKLVFTILITIIYGLKILSLIQHRYTISNQIMEMWLCGYVHMLYRI